MEVHGMKQDMAEEGMEGRDRTLIRVGSGGAQYPHLAGHHRELGAWAFECV